MADLKVSFVVPYKNRLNNISLLFAALANQTMPKDEFEVVVGAMEYSPAYAEVCNSFADRLNIVSVCTSRPWQVALARNIAIRQATGKILVFLDADMILSPKFLENLYYQHFAYGQTQCLIGQMINYDNNNSDVTSITVHPYSHYEEMLLAFERAPQAVDDRFKVPHHIPWAFAWTALIALPRASVEKHGLYFDEGFYGYGVEDLEWGYRICQAGIPIALKADVFGIHLPHLRNVSNNRDTERVNYRYFLNKFPALDVELTCVFGDFAGNGHYAELRLETQRLTGHSDHRFCVVKGTANGRSLLLVGLIDDGRGTLLDASALARFDRVEAQLPLLGLALPYADQSIDACIMLPSLQQLSPAYRDLVAAECARVAAT